MEPEVLLLSVISIALLITLIGNIVILRSLAKLDSHFTHSKRNMFELSGYLQSIEQQLAQLNKQHHLSNHQTSPVQNYDYAKKILDTGGSSDELLDNCDMSIGEAELLAALHKRPVT